jgi:hypothetical protein
MLGQRLDAFVPWLAHLARGTPVVLQTQRAMLAAVLKGGAVDAVSDDEAAYLRSVFPDLGPAAPTTLDSHQQAHLLAWRLHRVEEDLGALLLLDEDGRVRRQAGSWEPVPSEHVELIAISDKTGYDDFIAFRFERDAWPLAGVALDSGPTGAVLLPSLKEPAARRTFAFSAAMQLLRGLSRGEGGLQGWLQVGLAHAIEDRHAGKTPRSGATLPPGSEVPKDWDAFVGDMVTGGKVGDLGALAATPAHALSVRSRLQSWSMARWMIDRDPAKLAAW